MKDNHNDIDRGQFTDPIFFGRKLIFLFVVVALIAGCSWYFLSRQVLVITPVNSSDGRIILPLEDNNQWYLRYTHSVQKTTVDECFKVQSNNTFLMYRTRYSSFGVGLPFLPGEGEIVFLPNNTMQLDLKNPRIFPVVKIWTGVEAKVNIVTGDTIFPLYEKYPPGTLVQISTCRRYQAYSQ